MEKKEAIRLIISTVISAFVSVILYVFLHESGHCIAAIACGATITEFSIVSAHMNYAGGSYPDTAAMWLHANGMIFPLIISYIYMFLYRRKTENRFYHLISFFIVLIPAVSAFAWVLIPIAYITGNAPAGDDVTKFLDIFSSVHCPIWISMAALILIAISVILMVKKGILHNYIKVLTRKKEGTA